MPSLSVALAAIAILAGAEKEALFKGDVMATVGGTLAAAVTVTLTAVEVVTAPLLSVALAVIVYVPAATLLQVYEYGLMESVVNKVAPL